MSALPKISLVTVVRNGEAHLARAFASVAAQNYPNLEYIVIDGASTDRTIDIIKAHSHLISHWKSEPDNGPPHAANKALALATGDYVGFLSGDDILANNALQTVGEAIIAHPEAEMISGGCDIVYADGRKRVFIDAHLVDFSLSAALAGITLFNSRFYKRSLFTLPEAFRETFPGQNYFVACDRELLIKLALRGVKNVSVSGILYHYFAHAKSITFGMANRIATQKEHIWLADQFTNKHGITVAQKALFRQWVAQECVVLCVYAFQAKKPQMTLPALIYALGHPLYFTVAICKLAARFIKNRI